MAFRADIQGLRALAVLLVVAYHLAPQQLSGGFVGVDVFFVISGFLITSHLIRELRGTATISLSRFWAGRIRRLLPASLLVLAFSIVATFMVLPASMWKQTFLEAGASSIYAVNWALASSSTDYLDANNVPSIVQQYWSLSVEEQFYLLWPLLILGAFIAATRMRLSSRATTLAIVSVLGVVAVASFTASATTTASEPSLAYFATTTRAWEFAAGGLLALLPRSVVAGSRRGWVWLTVAASWTGLFAIVGAAFTFDGDTPFPGMAALMPVIGTALMIAFGEVRSPWSPAFVSEFAPVLFVGALSYSIYLWHWPLIILYPYVRGGDMGFRGSLVVLAATVGLAWLTKTFVEDPFRHARRMSGRKPAYALALTGASVIVAASLVGNLVIDAREAESAQLLTHVDAFTSQEQLTRAIDATLLGDVWQPADQLPGTDAQSRVWVVDKCKEIYNDEISQRCIYGSSDAEYTAVVLGDSFASAFMPGINAALAGPGEWKVIPLTYGLCPTADIKMKQYKKTTEAIGCNKQREWVFEKLETLQPDLVILANSASASRVNFLSGSTGQAALDEWHDGLVSYIDRLTKVVPNTVMFNSPPPTNCLPDLHARPSACEPFDRPTMIDVVEVERNATSEAGIEYVDVRPWFCDETLTLCPDQVGEFLVRADRSHITDSFSRRLGTLIREALNPVIATASK